MSGKMFISDAQKLVESLYDRYELMMDITKIYSKGMVQNYTLISVPILTTNSMQLYIIRSPFFL